jgi:hypothetical protein
MGKNNSVRLTIVGRIYVNAPVNSNMMTTTVTVILMTPLRALRMRTVWRITNHILT